MFLQIGNLQKRAEVDQAASKWVKAPARRSVWALVPGFVYHFMKQPRRLWYEQWLQGHHRV